MHDDTDPARDPALSQMLCFALYSAAHAMQKVYKPLLDPLGLTYPQYLALTALWGEDGQTVSQLGRAMQLESNTLTPLLKRLEAQGLVRRERQSGDERQVRLMLTDQGRALQGQAAHLPGCILAASGMTLPALQALQAEVTALRDHLRG